MKRPHPVFRLIGFCLIVALLVLVVLAIGDIIWYRMHGSPNWPWFSVNWCEGILAIIVL